MPIAECRAIRWTLAATDCFGSGCKHVIIVSVEAVSYNTTRVELLKHLSDRDKWCCYHLFPKPPTDHPVPSITKHKFTQPNRGLVVHRFVSHPHTNSSHFLSIPWHRHCIVRCLQFTVLFLILFAKSFHVSANHSIIIRFAKVAIPIKDGVIYRQRTGTGQKKWPRRKLLRKTSSLRRRCFRCLTSYGRQVRQLFPTWSRGMTTAALVRG